MGAFVLIGKDGKNKYDVEAILNTFTNKGFQNPRIFSLGQYELYLYQKQLVKTTNYYQIGESSIYIIGTAIYKGQGYHETMENLLADYLHDCIAYDQLIGSYCAIFYSNNQIYILNDALNICKLFHDPEDQLLTTSFLAAANGMYKLTIDRQASIEKLLTGYIVGENTLFNEVRELIPNKYKGKWHLHRWDDIIVPKPDRDRGQSVANRAETVKKYFLSIENLAKEFKAELGLSGGYDSRLLFAAALSSWPFPIDIHTHNTEGVSIHEIEKKIVQQIAEETGTKLRIVPTHSLDYYNGDEIDRFLIDGFYYFDGRCAYNTGAFSPTYTRKYKLDTISDHMLTLNGLGGEVYRNYYMNLKPVVSIKQWMKAKVYPDGVDYILDKETFIKTHDYICEKIRVNSAFSWNKFASPFQIRRYYSERRMPDCDALNCNAHNQMEFFLTPFIEKSMIEDAYKARNHIGVSGEFQADMIAKLNPRVASYKSHYGFSFCNKEPFKYKMYMLIRGILPDYLWNLRTRYFTKRNISSNKNKQFFDRVRKKSSLLKIATDYTEKLFPEIKFEYLRADYAMMPNSSYISIVFYMLKDKIAFEG